ncbi:MAG TPA: hypothetical protein VM032_19705 [Vicinamibacterales bacterium]|nr:hypothetical protein [Vicinamibacterales bacterium]
MAPLLTTLAAGAARLWRADRALTSVGWVMLALLAVFGVGLLVDPRTVTGMPVWLKPAKFAVSIAIYSFTLAWIFTFIPAWRRTRLWAGRISAAMFLVEIAIIAAQAWRGTTSHFNIGTPLDAVLFAAMGAGILVQTLSSVLVAVALWRAPLADRAMGAALRAGVIITILGASTAGLMTRMTGDQALHLRETGRVTTVGAHTVGAPDGGAGLPGTGWSLDHGDLRVPHFVGLHAMQVLPLLALVLRRRLDEPDARRGVRAAAVSYVALVSALLFQALRGEPLLAPGPATSIVIVAWAVGTGIGMWAATRGRTVETRTPSTAGV